MAKSMAQRKLEHAQRQAIPPRPTGLASRISTGGVGRAGGLPLIMQPTQPAQRMATRSSRGRNLATDCVTVDGGVCDWAVMGLCQLDGSASAFPVSLLKCSNCDNLLHHMCQTTWESKDPAREAHGSLRYCYHCHPFFVNITPPSDTDDIIIPEIPRIIPETQLQLGTDLANSRSKSGSRMHLSLWKILNMMIMMMMTKIHGIY
jgi:hypothetical protein